MFGLNILSKNITMTFKHTTIDPQKCTLEELKDEISRLNALSQLYDGTQNAFKVLSNSTYGALASPWFTGFNVDIAEAITLQGQHLNFYSQKILNDYFFNEWHLDKELHEKLGLTRVNKILGDNNLTIYVDTDSLVSNSLITTYTSGVKQIDQLYNENIHNFAGNTLAGHESVYANEKILNWSYDKKIYFAPVKRIIRHKVTKAKWKLKGKFSKEVIITNDHSLIVFRDDIQLAIKPYEVLLTDKILITNYYNGFEYYFDEIESCEQIGMFEDEYVYDIEVDDDTHTFIANDILVHNSVYITMKPVLDSCDAPTDKSKIADFILNIKKYRLGEYLDKKFEEYAKSFNTDNVQDLELEKISYNALMVAKKKYILDYAWKDPGIYYKPTEKIVPTGIETQQGSTPKFVKKILKDILKLLLEKGNELKYQEIISKLKAYKQEFCLQNPEDISKQVSIGDYEKYVLSDKKEIRMADKSQSNVQAAAIHNYLLQKSKYKSKYNLIKTGDKIKWYYTKDLEYEVFGFLPNNFPYEFAKDVDYDKQFEKLVIEPCNRFITAIGFAPVQPDLIVRKSLF